MSDTSTVVLVMCGLPAAGKSYWGCRLQDSASSRYPGKECEVQRIEFDAIEARLREEDEGLHPIAVWHRARSKALAQAESILHQERGSSTPVGLSKPSRRILILDDNMYYASMRRKVYLMAARNGAGYGCVHVDISVEDALSQNMKRPLRQRVDEKVIRRMNARLEAPNKSTRRWETNTLVIERQEEEVGARTLDKIWSVVERGWEAPAFIPKSCFEEEAKKERDRQKVRESVVHTAELALRRVIGTAMLLAGTDVRLPGTLSSLGRGFQVAKTEVMKRFREKSAFFVTQDTLEKRDVELLTKSLFAAIRGEFGNDEKTWSELEEKTLKILGEKITIDP